jgi:Cys-rich protein (TIGR01571 family)
VIPAGIFQKPFFDLGASAALNYGSIGAAIGHEMTHSIDPNGRKYNWKGNREDWSSPADEAEFEKIAQGLIDNANNYKSFFTFGIQLDGEAMRGEMCADNGGIQLAWDALKHTQFNLTKTCVDGFDEAHRFWYSWARQWAAVAAPEFIAQQVQTDVHPPADFRINGLVSMFKDWRNTFAVGRTQPLYRADNQMFNIFSQTDQKISVHQGVLFNPQDQPVTKRGVKQPHPSTDGQANPGHPTHENGRKKKPMPNGTGRQQEAGWQPVTGNAPQVAPQQQGGGGGWMPAAKPEAPEPAYKPAKQETPAWQPGPVEKAAPAPEEQKPAPAAPAPEEKKPAPVAPAPEKTKPAPAPEEKKPAPVAPAPEKKKPAPAPEEKKPAPAAPAPEEKKPEPAAPASEEKKPEETPVEKKEVPTSIPAAPVAEDKEYQQWTRTMLFTIAFIVMEVAVAAFYNAKKSDSTTAPQDGAEHSIALLQNGEFRYGLFDCLQVPSLTAFAFLCCPVRWADSMRMAGFLAFWTAAGIMIGLGAASPLTSGLTVILALIMAVYYRQKLRSEFGMVTGSLKSIAEDVVAYAFCPCLAVVQEARQLEEAYAVGHPIKKIDAEDDKKASA